MNFTENEMAAIVKVAKSLILADGHVDNSEVFLLDFELKLKPNIVNDVAILAAAELMEEEYALNILANFKDDEKKYVAGYLAKMCQVDGYVSDSEVTAWKTICKAASFSEMSFEEAIAFWKSH